MEEKLDQYLEMISAQYVENEQLLLAKIIVNAEHDLQSRYDVLSEYYEYRLLLSVPKELYLSCVNEKKELEDQILNDIQKCSLSDNRDIISVMISMIPSDGDWREQTGLLLSENPVVSPSTEARLWGDSPIHVFFSYSSTNLPLIRSIKEKLSEMGINPFVAEDDIQPSERWADEIRSALSSMHIMIAFLTEDFHQSIWTNQEIGFAIARKISIIPVGLGAKPEGFLSQFQVLTCDTEQIADKLYHKFCQLYPDCSQKLFLNLALYRFEHAGNYESANNAARSLYSHKNLSEDMIKRVINAYNSNDQIRGAYEIMKPASNSLSQIISYLQEVTGREYHIHHGILSIKE
ncbi:toll/interleukin-1 receptor domain-containing protein [Methanorbis rubei]|uniref:TIR domain-containing protein n=1 Tax=Methanorbis rubei TaxID=3028300 RepID=A0AAE4SAZ9_9EURY|nr:hypothetical protein [Methanocorpusculaceae archaeon Cs1]